MIIYICGKDEVLKNMMMKVEEVERMKSFTIKEEICIYQFKELCLSAREKAIEEHRQFLLEVMDKEDFISGEEEHDTEEELQKVYESEFEYYEENDEPIIESIEINEYYFYEDGKIANVTSVYKDGKIVENILKHNGKEYKF